VAIGAYGFLYNRVSHGTEADSRVHGFNDSNIFEVVNLPGKGKGVIATRDIKVSPISFTHALLAY
jgi:hypothetical protein